MHDVFLCVPHAYTLYICVSVCTIFSSMPLPLNISALNRTNSLHTCWHHVYSRIYVYREHHVHSRIHVIFNTGLLSVYVCNMYDVFWYVLHAYTLYICVYICTIFSSMPVPLNISAINRANSLSDASASSCSRTNTLTHSYLHCDIHSLQHAATHCNTLQQAATHNTLPNTRTCRTTLMSSALTVLRPSTPKLAGYMYVCVCLFVRICGCVFVCACVRVRVFARVNEYLHTHVFSVHRFVTIHSECGGVHVNVCECVRAYPCLCVRISKFTHYRLRGFRIFVRALFVHVYMCGKSFAPKLAPCTVGHQFVATRCNTPWHKCVPYKTHHDDIHSHVNTLKMTSVYMSSVNRYKKK